MSWTVTVIKFLGLGSRGVGGCTCNLLRSRASGGGGEDRSSFNCKSQIGVSGHSLHSIPLMQLNRLEMVEQKKKNR